MKSNIIVFPPALEFNHVAKVAALYDTDIEQQRYLQSRIAIAQITPCQAHQIREKLNDTMVAGARKSP